MTAIADEIRAWTRSGQLHPLVTQNIASPRGLCLGSWRTEDGGRAFCDLDYLHSGPCSNRSAETELARLGAALESLGGWGILGE